MTFDQNLQSIHIGLGIYKNIDICPECGGYLSHSVLQTINESVLINFKCEKETCEVEGIVSLEVKMIYVNDIQTTIYDDNISFYDYCNEKPIGTIKHKANRISG